MKAGCSVEIVDATENTEYERYLYSCLFHIKQDEHRGVSKGRTNFYDCRCEYLKYAIPKGFHKKILILEGDCLGTIEYAPADGSGLPIIGDSVIVMNCIWVHRKAQGRGFGRLLLKTMMEGEKEASGFATLALENYWGIYFRKNDMEGLGFRSVESLKVRHRTKNRDRCFEIHLMWLPRKNGVEPPVWDESRLLKGVYFCPGHSVFHDRHLTPSQRLEMKEVLEKC